MAFKRSVVAEDYYEANIAKEQEFDIKNRVSASRPYARVFHPDKTVTPLNARSLTNLLTGEERILLEDEFAKVAGLEAARSNIVVPYGTTYQPVKKGQQIMCYGPSEHRLYSEASQDGYIVTTHDSAEFLTEGDFLARFSKTEKQQKAEAGAIILYGSLKGIPLAESERIVVSGKMDHAEAGSVLRHENGRYEVIRKEKAAASLQARA